MTQQTDEAAGRYQHVLSPYRIGSVVLRNRVVMPAHSTNFGLVASTVMPGGTEPAKYQRHIDYYLDRARGGAGLIITESVRMFRPLTSSRKLNATLASSIADLTPVAEAVKNEGAAIFAQLNEPGRHLGGTRRLDRPIAIAPSAVPWSPRAEAPHALLLSEVREIVRSFGPGTRTLQESGFDGVELQLAHGHLVQQFLSPASNTRVDEYGGNRENRMRFAREILAEINAACDLPVGIRVSADEFLPGGLDLAETLEIVANLHDEFGLAFVHVSHSSYVESFSLSTQIADMTFPAMPYLRFAAAFKRHFPSLAVIAVCRIDDLDLAEGVIARGDADLVGMARPHMVDPDLVRKAQNGLSETTRHCIACNQGCAGRLEEGLPISCVVNPAIGLEAEWRSLPGPATKQRLLVVGGGPAGLDAAVSAAERGHDVTLVDRAPRLGGQILHAAALVGRERFQLLTRELERDARRAGIAIILGTEATAADVLSGDWDEVIVATGAGPARKLDAGPVAVCSTEYAIEHVGALGDNIVIRDSLGGWDGAGLAEHLAHQGMNVTLLVPSGDIAQNVTVYSRMALLRRLGELGVNIEIGYDYSIVSAGEVLIKNTTSGRTTRMRGVSMVVDVTPRIARDGLAVELSALGYQGALWLVGDAFQPRTALEAVYEGRLAAHAVGVRDLDPLFRFGGFRPPIPVFAHEHEPSP